MDPRPQVAAAFIMSPPPARPLVDCGRQACLALTFDDGPSADATAIVLDALARHHAHATFFVVGSHIAGNEGLLRRMYQEGHEVGNHSWSHPHFTALTPDQMRAQVNDTQAAVVRAGVPAPTLLRPPYGDVNSTVEATIPMTVALWNVDPEDWNHKKPEDIPPLVENHVRAGRVVVLHDMHRPTADSLDTLLADLQKDYTLVTFSQLFDLPPGQPGRYYGR
jgi:peptidoglycan/xylan/chitin deacetylase (PgdA/CDA1 family)